MWAIFLQSANTESKKAPISLLYCQEDYKNVSLIVTMHWEEHAHSSITRIDSYPTHFTVVAGRDSCEQRLNKKVQEESANQTATPAFDREFSH